MKRFLVPGLLLLAFAAPVLADQGVPSGWKLGGTNAGGYEIGTGAAQGMEGKQAAYIKPAKDASLRKYGSLFQTIRAKDYRGKYVRFSARMKGENNVVRMQMWIGADDAAGRTAGFFDRVGLSGSTGWQRYEVVLKIHDDAETISFGVLLGGARGVGWVDAARFETVSDEDGEYAVARQIKFPKPFANMAVYGERNQGVPSAPYPDGNCCVIWTPERGRTAVNPAGTPAR